MAEIYNPENRIHRRELADKLAAKLSGAGFKKTVIKDKVRRKWVKEDGYVLTHRKDPGLQVQVLTSITSTGEVRGKGADAIRVRIAYYTKERRENEEKGFIAYSLIIPASKDALNKKKRAKECVGSNCRTHRVGTIDDIVTRTTKAVNDAYQMLNDVERCRNSECQAPMFKAKSGKYVCSEACWAKKTQG